MQQEPIILSIESSCDETSAAVLLGRKVLSNVIAGQAIHEKYGGVVPELASRAHQANIVPTVSEAIRQAGIQLADLSAIAFTQGPGLMGSLLVGASFAKSLSVALHLPLIAVHHIEAHVLAHFIENESGYYPRFPFLCLTISGGHTQIIKVESPHSLTIIGKTLDDAAGEAFDKAAKLLGLPYPGGPVIDKLSLSGDPFRFTFTTPQVAQYNYSFSGLKTSLLYFLRDQLKTDADFIEKNKADICASYQRIVVEYLIQVFEKAAIDTGITDFTLAGGVSANRLLRKKWMEMADKNNARSFIPPLEYCTDNAAMIGIVAYFKWCDKKFSDLCITPMARM